MYDSFEDEYNYYTVLEFCNSKDLNYLVKTSQSGLSEDEAIYCMK